VRALALASLAVLAGSVAFLFQFVKPLEERAQRLERDVQPTALKRVALDTPAARLEAFHTRLDRAETKDEWLAKLYAAARASGLELRAAQYRLAESRQRIERYEISLPVSGSYSQIRRFLESALADIPVMSLDRASFRRKAITDGRVEAEIVVTLHLLRK